MIFSDIVGIVADDLTGANDTALQFHLGGANTEILLNQDYIPNKKQETEVWAVSTESRNIPANQAVENVKKALKSFQENFSFEYYYKKIDSTMCGNIAPETLTMINILGYDVTIAVKPISS